MFGITLNGKHSYIDYGMFLAKRPEISSPEAKTILVDIPGADGSLDLTEVVTGDAKFYNRTITLTFAIMLREEYHEVFKSKLLGDLHGKIIEAVFDSDPDWVWRGRASVSFDNILPWKMTILVEIDADPYKMARDETVFDFSSNSQGRAIEFEIGTNNSLVYYNSRFLFGDGQDFSGNFSRCSAFKIRWSQNARRGNFDDPPVVTFTDNQGHQAGYLINFATGELTVTKSVLESHDPPIDVSHIVSVVVQRIGNVALYAVTDSLAAQYIFENERMTVVPRFQATYTGNGTMMTIINKKQYTIPSGSFRDPEIVFKEGRNEIVMIGLANDPSMRVSISFRKGRL